MRFQAADSLAEQIASHLTEQIFLGALRDGERIREIPIAAALGVSRSSVREALLLLQRRHLIELLPRRGAAVRSVTAGHAAEVLDLFDLLLQAWVPRFFRNAFPEVKRTTLRQLELIAAAVRGQAAMQGPSKHREQLTLLQQLIEVLLAAQPALHNALIDRLLADLYPPLIRMSLHALERSPPTPQQWADWIDRLIALIRQEDGPGLRREISLALKVHARRLLRPQKQEGCRL